MIVAIGLTFLFIAGEIDLSIGANQAFSSVVMALAITNHGVNPWGAAALAVLAGMLVGAVNGLVVTVIGVPSFIVTLGMLSILGGGSLVLTDSLPVAYPDTLQSSFFAASNGTVFSNFPTQILWAAALFALGSVLLKFTRFGYHVYGVGGNSKAAHEMGVKVQRVKFLCFMMTGAFCGLTGALQGGWLREGDPSSGDSFTLQTIAAVILGGWRSPAAPAACMERCRNDHYRHAGERPGTAGRASQLAATVCRRDHPGGGDDRSRPQAERRAETPARRALHRAFTLALAVAVSTRPRPARCLPRLRVAARRPDRITQGTCFANAL